MNTSNDSALTHNQTKDLHVGVFIELTDGEIDTLVAAYDPASLLSIGDVIPGETIHHLENLMDKGLVLHIPGYWSERIHHPAQWFASLAGERWLNANHIFDDPDTTFIPVSDDDYSGAVPVAVQS